MSLRKPIELVICDVDGTLVDRTEKLSAPLIARIKQLSEVGVKFTLASGRVGPLLATFSRQLNISLPLIAANGATILSSGKTLLARTVPIRELRTLIRTADASGLTVLYSVGGTEYAVRETSWVSRQQQEFDRYHLIAMPDEEQWETLEVEKVSIYDGLRTGQIDEYDDAARGLGLPFGVTRYTNRAIEIVHIDATKAAAAAAVAEMLAIPMTRVLAIGDHHNDRELIQAAGIGACVANAQPEIRSVSDYVADAENGDGVFEILDRFCPVPARAGVQP